MWQQKVEVILKNNARKTIFSRHKKKKKVVNYHENGRDSETLMQNMEIQIHIFMEV